MLLCTGCMLATLGCERRLDPSEAPTVGFFAVGRIELDERQERTREFGLRMALGAREGQVLAMVLREGAWMAGLGVLVGGLASVILARFLRGLLFDVGPGEARTHSAVALLFVFVALFAAWLPARRDPGPPGGRPPQRMSRSWTVTIVRSER